MYLDRSRSRFTVGVRVGLRAQDIFLPWDLIAQRDCWELVRRARRGIWGAGTLSSPGWVWVRIITRERHTFRVNKSSESRVHCLNISSQVWWWVLNDRARARDHALLRACVHGWVVRLRLVEFEPRRQAALVATGRAPRCVVLQLSIVVRRFWWRLAMCDFGPGSV